MAFGTAGTSGGVGLVADGMSVRRVFGFGFGFGEGGWMRLEVCDDVCVRFRFFSHVGAIPTAVADWLCCVAGWNEKKSIHLFTGIISNI